MRTYNEDENTLIIVLPDRVDSNNCASVEQEMAQIISNNEGKQFKLDANETEYLSSAALRVLLSLKKQGKVDTIFGVSNEIYGIFDLTGFNNVFNIIHKVETIEVKEENLLGVDSYGYLYKADDENVIRIYNNYVSSKDINDGFDYSKALIQSDLSMAIPFDTVNTTKGQGCIYAAEEFNTIHKLISDKPECRNDVLKKIVSELNKIHGKSLSLPGLDKFTVRLTNMVEASTRFSDKEKQIIKELIPLLSKNSKVIFEDINERTILCADNNPVFIDFSLLRYGNIIFELAGFYRSVYEFDSFFGSKNEEVDTAWREFLKIYLNSEDDEVIDNYSYASTLLSALLSLVIETEQESEDLNNKLTLLVKEGFIQNRAKLEETFKYIKKHQDSLCKNGSECLEIQIRERTAWQGLRKKTLLKDIDITMYPGEMILLLGGSGAGKTTFLNAVTGYEKADASITKGNIDIYRDYASIKHRIAFAPQQDLLRNEDTVYNTLRNAADMRLPIDTDPSVKEDEINRMLEIFGLSDHRDSCIRTLSGGQRKRASIAVEFIANPILFFLDEPDSGLDGVMARSLMEDLRKITGDDKIIVVISHAPDRVIDLFDKVIILAKSQKDGVGHLAFYGEPKEAKEFFEKDTMEHILKIVNRKNEGGEGRADEFIEKYKIWR